NYRRALRRRVNSRPYHALVDLGSDKLVKLPSIRFAAGMESAGSNVYAYQFDFQSPQADVGACHCFELPFLLGNFENWVDAPMLNGIDLAAARSLSACIQEYVLNFVETGDPNGADLPAWPVYDRLHGRKTMHLGELIESVASGV
ncbi:MAG TPA: carboxylesterase family protein, partial [Paraburkholderia sp.]